MGGAVMGCRPCNTLHGERVVPTTTCKTCCGALCTLHAEDTTCSVCRAPLCPWCAEISGIGEETIRGQHFHATGNLCFDCHATESRLRWCAEPWNAEESWEMEGPR